MIRAFTALALNGFREARRNRVSVVIAAFTFSILLASTLVTEVTVFTFKRVLTDVGIGGMSISLVLLAVFLSSGLLSREIERRTIFLIVSKPVSRGLFLVARFAGNMLTLLAMLTAMTAIFAVQTWLYGTPLTAPQYIAISMLLVELLVISSFGFLMSSFASQMVSAVATIGTYFIGHLSADIYTLSGKSDLGFVRVLGKVVYYAVPNLDRLNFRPQSSYELVTPVSELLKSVGYGAGYTGILISLAVFIFSRRDFK